MDMNEIKIKIKTQHSSYIQEVCILEIVVRKFKKLSISAFEI